MRNALTAVLRTLSLMVPIAIGLVIVFQSDSFRTPPQAVERTRPPMAVRVVTLAPIELVPRITGYGTVAPAREWRAVARVEGEVTQTSPRLESGALVEAGEVLLTLDDSDLKLDLAEIDARLALLDVREDATRASLEIAQSDLALAQAELAREEALAGQGVATAARRDAARRQELAVRAKVTEIENQLALAGAERGVLAAERASVERALGFTQIAAPYDMRIVEVAAETGQYVSRGQTLLSAEGTEAAEIAAQFPIGRIGPLLREAGQGATVLDLKARVRLTAPGHDVVWKAQVDRVGEAIDPRTQSGAVVVRVDDPVAQAQAGARPPLRRNTFVEVTLSAPSRPVLAAPLEAVAGGRALVVTPEGTLERRTVTLGYTVGGLAVIEAGLAEGDRLVVSEPAQAMPGTAVKAVEDKATLAALAAEAGGARSGGGGKGGGKGASQ